MVTPYTKLLMTNCDDPTDKGVLRYGDAIWLQAGLHDVIGADFSESVSAQNQVSLYK